MPVHKLPNGKYKWGNSGKEYDTKEQAEAQGRAILGTGWREKSTYEPPKQNQFQKPPKLERCVEHLMRDPNFKPKTKGQDKRSAAYAVCTASLNKAMDDIQEAIVILKQFEDDTDTSGFPPDDMSDPGYGDGSYVDSQDAEDMTKGGK